MNSVQFSLNRSYACIYHSDTFSIKNQSFLSRNTYTIHVFVYMYTTLYNIINIIMAYTQVIEYIMFFFSFYFYLLFGYGPECVNSAIYINCVYVCLLNVSVNVNMWILIGWFLKYTFNAVIHISEVFLFSHICWYPWKDYQVIGDTFYHPTFFRFGFYNKIKQSNEKKSGFGKISQMRGAIIIKNFIWNGFKCAWFHSVFVCECVCD